MPKTMYSFIFLAQGFEEIEAISVADVLRRGGMDVKTVSIYDSYEVTGAHNITIKADMLFKDIDFNDAEWLIFPGGLPGAENLHKFDALNFATKRHFERGGKVAAICAAPALVLAPLGILKDKDATCYPGFEDKIIGGGATYRQMPIVALDNLITANGPHTAARFGLAIVSNSRGERAASEVGTGMLYYKSSTPYSFYF